MNSNLIFIGLQESYKWVIILYMYLPISLNTEADERAEVEVALGRSRLDSRNSTNIESLRKIGCCPTRFTNLSKATLRREMNSFSVDRCSDEPPTLPLLWFAAAAAIVDAAVGTEKIIKWKLETLKRVIAFSGKNFYLHISSILRLTWKIWISRQKLNCNLLGRHV